ncbi:serine/threonine-protein phosphatase [Nocardioides sp. HDW12B]|uniref:PP2C family protein-serine/threonine phosphatase n=1 Tax=Nocardioides sp. HDW12B TaxID=2714939 RepID=UPI0014090340|nr:PP2C family protein-serine/threonine phosphatase [Nocardioides sp. HDW12B]QIK66223.1 serine/threonine-protein phosphatase [Nocardioides sp. HDW12B]
MHIFSREFGPLAAAYDAVDWAATPLGPVDSWSATLLGTVDLMTHTPFPVSLLWGPELRLVYNEAFVALIGDKHPTALGRPVQDVAPESWDVVGPMMRSVLAGEPAVMVHNALVPLQRHGFLEECWFTWSYSPVRGPGGVIGGVINIATETTVEVLARRRVELLGVLAEQLATVSRADQVAAVALTVLRSAERDLPDVAFHLPAAWSGATDDVPEPPGPLPPQASTSREFILNGDGGRTVWLPLTPPGSEPGHLVVTPSPMLLFDREYHDFVRLVAALLRQTLDRVRARDVSPLPVPARATPTGTAARPPGTPRPQIAVRHRPSRRAAQRGGDWYDVFDLPGGDLAVVVGDLDDREDPDDQGPSAVARVRSLLHGAAFALAPAGPRDLLAGLDRALAGTSPGTVATALLAHVRTVPDGLEVRWSNAGHPPPVLLPPAGEASALTLGPDLLLGVDPATARTEHVVTVPPGGTLVLCSDGLLLRRHSSLTTGTQWLVGTLHGLADQDAEDIADFVLGKSGQGADDAVLVVLRA